MITRWDYAGELTDRDALVEQLLGTGLSRSASEAKADRFAQAASAFGPARGRPAAFFVPGRIEVFGKHTDYAGGQTATAAVERGLCLVAAPRDDRRVIVTDAAWQETARFELDPELVPQGGHWSNYPMTVARRIARNFPAAHRGADIAFACDLPSAAGLSSSSVLIVAMFLALAEVNDIWSDSLFHERIADSIDLAGYLANVENGQSFGPLAGDRGVGTIGGSEDHTAILCSYPGHFCRYSYCPVRLVESVPMPNGYTLAIGASGVVAEKTGKAMEKYNRASRLTAVAAELWRRETGRDDPHLGAAVAGDPEAAARLRAIVEDACCADVDRASLRSRVEHFLLENEEIVPAAAQALRHGDVSAFGTLIDRSQRAAEQLLGNQVPETVYLAATARTSGAAAASAFGAGFGGSVWALVETPAAETFLSAWATGYRAAFPQHAGASSFFLTGAGPPAFRVT